MASTVVKGGYMTTRIPHRSRYLLPLLFLVIWMTLCLGSSPCAKVTLEQLRVPKAGTTQIITMRDGSTLTGRITQVSEDKVVFSSTVGEVTVPIDQIEDIREVADSSMKGGKFWFPNPNQSRLYISPTGRTLEAGAGYFSDILLFFPSITYGLTNNVSVGGGFSLLPGIDIDHQLFYLFPKVGMQASEKVALAASVLIVRLPDFDEDDDIISDEDQSQFVGVLFGTCTVGDGDKSLTFGLGDGFVDGDFADKPAVLVGGEYRVARRMSLVTENWVFPGVDDPLISYGVRFFGEGLSVDLAFVNILSEDAFFPGIPLLGVTYNF
jgi:hypothetical protein